MNVQIRQGVVDAVGALEGQAKEPAPCPQGSARQGLGPRCLNACLCLVSLSPEKPSAPVQSLHHVLQPGLPQRPQRGPLCAQLLRQPPPVPPSQRLSGVWTLPLGESSGWEMPGGVSRAGGGGSGRRSQLCKEKQGHGEREGRPGLASARAKTIWRSQ